MKKQVKLYITEENTYKMKYIALNKNSKISTEYERSIEKYIKEYEAQHGAIKVPDPDRGGGKLK